MGVISFYILKKQFIKKPKIRRLKHKSKIIQPPPNKQHEHQILYDNQQQFQERPRPEYQERPRPEYQEPPQNTQQNTQQTHFSRQTDIQQNSQYNNDINNVLKDM